MKQQPHQTGIAPLRGILGGHVNGLLKQLAHQGRNGKDLAMLRQAHPLGCLGANIGVEHGDGAAHVHGVRKLGRHPDGPQWRYCPGARSGRYRDHAAGGVGKLAAPVAVHREQLAIGKGPPRHHHIASGVLVQRVICMRHGLILMVFDLELKAGQTTPRHIGKCVKAPCRDFHKAVKPCVENT